MKPIVACLLAAAVAAPALRAQTTVHFPDAVIMPPQGQLPISTGSFSIPVRGQSLCPANFAGLPSQRMIVSKVALQLAGEVRYSTFLVRVGTTRITTLTQTWATNLPDQRVQVDLSGQLLPGGMNGTTQVNHWVEFDLRYPFVFTPGDAIVLDIVARSAVDGVNSRTAFGSVSRLIESNHTGSPTTTQLPSNGGLKFGLTFHPLDVPVPFGVGCPGSGGAVPRIEASGQCSVGSANYVLRLGNGLGGAPSALIVGTVPAVDPIGGGCVLWLHVALSFGAIANGNGAGQGTAAIPLPIPNDASLAGASFPVQWAQIDAASPAVVPVALSAGGKVVVY